MASDTIVREYTDISASDPFRVYPENGPFQVDGPGKINAIVIVAQDESFELTVETDSAVIVDGSFDEISVHSQHLPGISTSTSDGRYSITIQGYPFNGFMTATIVPNGTVTFDRIRAEWFLYQ